MNLFCKDQKSLSKQGQKNFDAIRWDGSTHLVGENEHNHRRMWRWMAKTGKHKQEWPGWEINGGKISDLECHAYCFACAVGYRDAEDGKEYCECPITWDKEAIGGLCPCERRRNSPYAKWRKALFDGDINKIKKYAAIIAELPWNERRM